MADTEQERTEAPTARRQTEAREEGNIARSADLTAAVVLLAAVILLHWFGMKTLGGLKSGLQVMLAGDPAANATRADDLGATLWFGGRVMVMSAAPLVLGITAVALVVTVAQVGFIFTTKPLEPSLSKLSPFRGLRQLLDARAGARLGMSLVKLVAIVSVTVVVVMRNLPAILSLPQLEVAPLFIVASEMIYDLALKIASLLLVLAVLDFAYQKWQHLRDLRMTKEEVKEELKRMEGDPLIKQRRSRVARQLAMQRVGQAVPKADVVVTNPTHYAVALQYDSTSMRAPKVVAKGADFMAMRIRQLAALHGIPMVERRELAQGLYKTVDIGREVPPEFYNAVAEILAYVYRLGGRKSA